MFKYFAGIIIKHGHHVAAKYLWHGLNEMKSLVSCTSVQYKGWKRLKGDMIPLYV